MSNFSLSQLIWTTPTDGQHLHLLQHRLRRFFLLVRQVAVLAQDMLASHRR